MRATHEQLACLVSHTWIHIFEADENGVEVYRVLEKSVVPARRPREKLRFRADGTADVQLGSPDDRGEVFRAFWQVTDTDVRVTVPSGPLGHLEYRIVLIGDSEIRIRVT
jgi:hypothetical protein